MPETHDTYQSPLATRNSGPEMLRLFSPRYKFSLWRKLWLELARCQRELGISRISADAIAQMEKAVDSINFDRAAEWEARLKHDVMAHIKTFEEAAPAAEGIVHLGATSMDIVDSAELIILRDALRLVAENTACAIDALATFAEQWKDLPALSYTHYQPAQVSTIGKRATLWAQDFAISLAEIEHRLETLRFRGLKGATGTQAAYLGIFDGDAAKVELLDSMFTQRMGFASAYTVTGQTYPRVVDAQIINALATLAAAVHKFCNDIRLLAGAKQIEEPFEEHQVGSSAMAYKRNPMMCERATGLARFVISLSSSALNTAAEQWLERTLDDSSNKRLVGPEAFLAIDGCLRLVITVARGLVVYPKTIEAHLNAELPFMATEEFLMAAVAAGASRQEAHEIIRRHSQAAAQQVKMHGQPNDLLQRLSAEPSFAKVDLQRTTAASAFVGLAPRQVEQFLRDVAAPIRKRYASVLAKPIRLAV